MNFWIYKLEVLSPAFVLAYTMFTRVIEEVMQNSSVVSSMFSISLNGLHGTLLIILDLITFWLNYSTTPVV